MTVNLDEWPMPRRLGSSTTTGRFDVLVLARRLIAAIADAEDALAEGDKD